MKAVIYSRVSTSDKQNTKRQINDLKSLPEFNVVKVFSESISGFSKSMVERTEFNKMLSYIEKNNIEAVLVSELSRLGRRTIEVLKFIELLDQKGICLHIQNLGMTLGRDNDKDKIFNRLVVTILTDIYRMESENLSYRIKSGIKYRKEIKKLPTGRQYNSKETKDKFLSKHKTSLKYLKQGYSYSEITKITGLSSTTISKLKKVMAEQEQA